MNRQPPAVLYAAKSTTDVHGSIPTQLADGRAAAVAESLEVIAEYTDEAYSAFSGSRGPGLASAMERAERLAREHGEAHLFVQHSDRLARGDGRQAAHLVEYALWAIKAGVKLRSLQDPQTFGDLLYTVVTGQRNHEDSARKSKSVSAGARRRAERGLFPGGRRMKYGYARTTKDEPPLVVAAEAAIVRRMYAESAAGRSHRDITIALNTDGIRTSTGLTWDAATVGRILSDPVYKGCIRIKGETVFEDGSWAIIGTDLWERVAQGRKARGTAQGKGRGRRTKGAHLLLGGLLRCTCGAPMTTRRNTRHGTEYYVCRRRTDLKVYVADRCTQPYIKRKLIDGALVDYFSRVGLDVEATRRDYLARTEHELAAAGALRAEAEREEARAHERLARIKRDYVDGKIDAEDWRAFRDDLGEQAQAAARAAGRQRARETDLSLASDLSDAESDLLQRLAELRAAVVGEVRDASTIDAIRVALLRLFESFTLAPSGASIEQPQAGNVDVAGVPLGAPYVLIPRVRREAVLAIFDNFEPVLKRETLSFAGVSKNESTACSSLVFQPIELSGRPDSKEQHAISI